ncbi:MAG TPA: hypothetical protein VFH31_06205 [Pyrinomonadaceae bacterium]|nr:hypothetical protein [Pyrinomonadaceae bacterium]
MSDKIIDKFEFYDVLGSLVPGLVAIGMIFGAWWWTGHRLQIPSMPQGVPVLVILATAIVVGQVIQALGSLVEPFYYWTWGGRPSDRALKAKGKQTSSAQAERLRKRLANYIGADTSRPLTDQEVFLGALSLCTHKTLGRVQRFNSLYAYHRALTTLLLISTIMTLAIIFFVEPNPPAAWPIVLCELVATLLLWFRTKQRASYYVDEVLRMADLELGFLYQRVNLSQPVSTS